MVRHKYIVHIYISKHVYMIQYLCEVKSFVYLIEKRKQSKNGNDPYAGSPTNTLLRLLLPLNDPV